MAEIKNLFVKSKMNKDLDARLLTNGEYRDAQNVSVSKSEGADVGAVENILGNIELIDFETIVTNAVTAKYTALGLTISTDAINYKNLEAIGQIPNLENNSVVVFLTDWTDTSNDKLSNFPGNAVVATGEIPEFNDLVYAGPGCFICYYSFQTGASSILAGGSYLNFSKSHPMLGLDYLEDFLYFTDNRNQPRKINVSTALAQPYTSNAPYYGSEDDISVCKFAPYEPIGFIDAGDNSTLISRSEQFLPSNVNPYLNNQCTAGSNTFILNGVFNTAADIVVGGRLVIPNSSEEYIIATITDTGSNTTTLTTTDPNAPLVTLDGNTVLYTEFPNPYYDPAFGGDLDLLKEEFPRYSYRFRYDDGEYSLMAPFSQIAFVPEQYGYFLLGDEQDAGESGIVKFVENRVDQIFLQIPMPSPQSQLSSSYKVSELQILVKNAGENVVRVIEDVLVNNISYSSITYSYQYDSTQPFKTLPEKDITRVSDKAPVRAASQAIIGNRVVYGNYLDKHTHPISLNFSAKIEQKNSISTSTIRKEFPNHTLKQNRTYQLGLVLMDRYGRSSGVITSDNLALLSGTNKKSSIYSNYTNGDASARDWPGNCLGLIMNEPVPSFMSEIGYPGLYSYKNPLGWYSYKVVVKQTEQEYYNVYVPGAIAGNITWSKRNEVTKEVISSNNNPSSTHDLNNVDGVQKGMSIIISGNGNKGVFITGIAGTTITLSESYVFAKDSLITLEQIIYPSYPNPYATSNIVLFGDNINKVPRNLNKVGPTDRIYSSDVRLFNRVNPIFDASLSTPRFYNTQHTFASPLVGDEAISIRPFRDLGEWTSQSSRYYPVANEYNVTSGTANAEVGAQKLQLFYKSEDNPFIATLTTNSLIGVNPVLSTSTTNNSDTYTNRNLGVFETEPTTSLLDIFWETSTSGLISDLNIAIDTNAEGPVGFTNVNFDLKESDPIGTVITNYFELVRSDGNPTADTSEVNMSNLQVVDGNQQDRTNDFQLVSNVASPETLFAIRTKSEFYHGSNAGTLENYTFTIDCVANGINNTLTIPGPTQLSNVAPSVNGNVTVIEQYQSHPNQDIDFEYFTPWIGDKDLGYVYISADTFFSSNNYSSNITSWIFFKIKNGSIPFPTNETLVTSEFLIKTPSGSYTTVDYTDDITFSTSNNTNPSSPLQFKIETSPETLWDLAVQEAGASTNLLDPVQSMNCKLNFSIYDSIAGANQDAVQILSNGGVNSIIPFSSNGNNVTSFTAEIIFTFMR